MEWVASLAGEPHSDDPTCVSPVVKRLCIALNDGLEDTDRQRLRWFLWRTIGTAGDGPDPQRRELCRVWVERHAVPDWLELAGRPRIADALRGAAGAATIDARVAAEAVWTVARRSLDVTMRETFARHYASDDPWTADSALRGAAAAAMDVARELARPGSAVQRAAELADDRAACAAACVAATDAAESAAHAARRVATGPRTTQPRAVRDAVYVAVADHTTARLRSVRERHLESAFQVLDQILPAGGTLVPSIAPAPPVGHVGAVLPGQR